MAEAPSQDKYLATLVEVLTKVHEQGDAIKTHEFCALMDHVVKVFDLLGAVLHFAKHDVHSKNESLKKAAAADSAYGTAGAELSGIVEADRAAGKATVKDTGARNLFRLAGVITFLRLLLENLSQSPTASVKDSASKAYEQALASTHPLVVRVAVRAGLHLMPQRDHFMRQIGETEESAVQPVAEFIAKAKDVEDRISKLFAGIDMPASNSSPIGLPFVGGWFGRK